MIEQILQKKIDINKTTGSKESKIWHYWYFKNISFKYIWSGCHGLMQKAFSFNDVNVAYVEGSVYQIHFGYISANDAISIMNNSNLID